MDKYIKEFLKYLETEDLSTNTINSYRYDLELFIKWLTKRLKETEDEELTMELNEALKTWGAVASIDYPILTDISDDFEPLAINYSNVFKSLFGEESLEHRCLEGDMLAIEEDKLSKITGKSLKERWQRHKIRKQISRYKVFQTEVVDKI